MRYVLHAATGEGCRRRIFGRLESGTESIGNDEGCTCDAGFSGLVFLRFSTTTTTAATFADRTFRYKVEEPGNIRILTAAYAIPRFSRRGKKGYVYSRARVAIRFPLPYTFLRCRLSGGWNKSRFANTGCYRGLITQSRPVRRYPSRLFTKKSLLSQQSILLSSLVPFPLLSHYRVSKSRNSHRSGERIA